MSSSMSRRRGLGGRSIESDSISSSGCMVAKSFFISNTSNCWCSSLRTVYSRNRDREREGEREIYIYRDQEKERERERESERERERQEKWIKRAADRE